MKIIRALSVMTCAFLLHANAQASEILIDDFSTNQGPVSDTIVDDMGSSNQVSTAGNDIVGGYRDIYVEEVENGVLNKEGDALGDDPTLGIHTQVSNGRFSATLDDLVKAYAVVTYDGANEVGSNWETGVDVDGLGGEDWTGTSGFKFEDTSNDIVAPVQLIVWTMMQWTESSLSISLISEPLVTLMMAVYMMLSSLSFGLMTMKISTGRA
ncbi:hypothetical protein ACOMICROBIO_FLGHMIGD_03609 [Vibrio sp. B1FLJ16]|nr:hypothetical protein ACOMICROBIO_FLGHMIGD_03609 [Vibrio sp. B1FLJ16]CAE6933329.1 hypothetical protein ACOMICROBIO_FLGHMIGD_03609 [Vibrio sp. B1FLJ16]